MKRGQQLNQELFEYALNSNSTFKPQIAQIADEASVVETLQRQKFTQEGTGINLRRYRIRICSMHDDDTPVQQLPFAYGQSPTSGLRGESSGAPIYPQNTFVTVFQDPDTGIYYIDDVHPNSVGILSTTKGPGCSAATGFVPGSALFYVPQTHYKDGRLVAGAEWFNTPRPSDEDDKQNKLKEDPPIVLPSKCRKVNTDGINSEITKLIRDIENLRTNLLGNDSFVATSQNFLNTVQSKVNQASAKIANWVTALIQEVRRFVERKINAVVGEVSGNAPLSTRFLLNEVSKNTLSIISCLFVRLLQQLESIIAAILNAVIDQIVNVASCVIENLLGNLLGQILAQLTSAINSVLGPLSNLVGSVISFTNELLDFAISILDFLTCKVENVCPTTEKWNILEAAPPASSVIDFNAVFSAAQGVVNSFVGLADIPQDLNNLNFNIDVNAALQETANCSFGPQSCSPPTAVFWGGNGSGATGNAVVNAVGDIIGVDIIRPGNYTSTPVISFEDNCGNGTGAYAIPILGITTITIPATGTGIGTTTRLIGITTTTTPVATPTGVTTTTVNGVVGVAMIQTGYGYLSSPNGSKGGMNRTWANRCQTIVRRANGSWDSPYSYGNKITLYLGDTIQLPSKAEVEIDCNFTANQLPGCIVTGTPTCLRSMKGFFNDRGTSQQVPNIKSMVGFDDLRGSSAENTPPISAEHQKRWNEIAASAAGQDELRKERLLVEEGRIIGRYRPDQFGFSHDYPYARELGFTDQDIRFYLEGFYSKLLGKRIGPIMQVVLDDPNFGPLPKYITGKGTIGEFDYENDYPYAVSLGYTDQEIRYYLQNVYRGKIAADMQKKLNDSSWGQIPEFYVEITAPDCPEITPPVGNNYDVIVSIGDVFIPPNGGGFGFAQGDTATVLDCAGNPDAATKIELDINQNGTITRARVIQSGTNFTCVPEIRLNTQTGYNAILKPVLKFTRAQDTDVPPGTIPLKVIDCVGKV